MPKVDCSKVNVSFIFLAGGIFTFALGIIAAVLFGIEMSKYANVVGTVQQTDCYVHNSLLSCTSSSSSSSNNMIVATNTDETIIFNNNANKHLDNNLASKENKCTTYTPIWKISYLIQDRNTTGEIRGTATSSEFLAEKQLEQNQVNEHHDCYYYVQQTSTVVWDVATFPTHYLILMVMGLGFGCFLLTTFIGCFYCLCKQDLQDQERKTSNSEYSSLVGSIQQGTTPIYSRSTNI
ncbi:hypothetical protein ABK040_002461 [Willaertia magna]